MISAFERNTENLQANLSRQYVSTLTALLRLFSAASQSSEKFYFYIISVEYENIIFTALFASFKLLKGLMSISLFALSKNLH